jgi:hypothetical protein
MTEAGFRVWASTAPRFLLRLGAVLTAGLVAPQAIDEAIVKLSKTHAEHIAQYGTGNEQRLTGKHETCDMNTFRVRAGAARWAAAASRQRPLDAQTSVYQGTRNSLLGGCLVFAAAPSGCFPCFGRLGMLVPGMSAGVARRAPEWWWIARVPPAGRRVLQAGCAGSGWPLDSPFGARRIVDGVCVLGGGCLRLRSRASRIAGRPSASRCPCRGRATATWRTGGRLQMWTCVAPPACLPAYLGSHVAFSVHTHDRGGGGAG